jgi:hypothetical protein
MATNLKCTLCQIVEKAEKCLEGSPTNTKSCLKEVITMARGALILHTLYATDQKELQCPLMMVKGDKPNLNSTIP